jgi:hypothetical protein
MSKKKEPMSGTEFEEALEELDCEVRDNEDGTVKTNFVEDPFTGAD